jgi:hypothetical protein
MGDFYWPSLALFTYPPRRQVDFILVYPAGGVYNSLVAKCVAPSVLLMILVKILLRDEK